MSDRKNTQKITNLDSSPIKNLTFTLKVEEEYNEEQILDITTRKRKLSLGSKDTSHIKQRFHNNQNIFNSVDKNKVDEDIFLLKKQETNNNLNSFNVKTQAVTLQKEYQQNFDDIYKKYSNCKQDCLKNKTFDKNFKTLFKSLINKCIKEHLLDKISTLVIDFLTTISVLLRQQPSSKYYKTVEEWLIDCFNITSFNVNVEVYYEILLQEYYKNNYEYLGVLKLVTLQLMLFQKDQNENITGTLLTFLTYDKRYLFGFNEITVQKIKIPNVIKILLHLSSYYKKIKFFIFCKIYEYIVNEELNITQILPQVKNIDNMVSLIKESYKHIDPDNNTLAYSFVSRIKIQMNLLPVKEPFTLNDTWRLKLENTFKTKKSTIKLYEFYNYYTDYLWSHSIKIEKRDLNIIKRILIKINDSLEFIKENKTNVIFLISPILSNIMNILISINDLVTLDNLTNIFFNLFVTNKDDMFLKYSFDSNFHIFLNTKRKEILYEESLKKFLKYTRCLISMEMRLSLFKQIFTTNSLQNNNSLTDACEFVIKYCLQYFELLPNLNIKELDCSSDLMKCLLLSKFDSNSTISDSYSRLSNEWSLILKMFFQIISPEIDSIIINFDEEILPNTCLYNERHFVKCCFQFYREMRKRSMMKLFKIGDYYLKNVLAERDDSYELTIIEKEFLKVLFQYLKLNGFYQLVVKIYQTVYKLKHIDISLMKELKITYLKIKNCLLELKMNSLDFKKDLLSLSSKDIDFENIGILLEQISSFKDLIFLKNILTKNYSKIWDYTNSSNVSKPLYIKILLFNMSFSMKEGDLLEMEDGQHVEALQSYKLVLSLGKSILKSVDSLPQLTRIIVINNLLTSFEKIIDLVLLLGNYLYYEYFIKEFDIILSSINEPIIRFKKYSLSIQFAELVFDKQEKFQHNVLKQVDLKNSDLVFVEYCERESKMDLIFDAYNSSNFKIYKNVLINKNYIQKNSDTPLGRLYNDSTESNDYRKIPLIKMKQKFENSKVVSEKNWNDCYKTLGITYEKQLTENVSDFYFEDQHFGNFPKNDLFDLPIESKVLSLDSANNGLLIGILENGRQYDIKLFLPNDLISNFAYNLSKIIKASNDSTSVQVTSKITTKEERKNWWVKRYTLDSQLEVLLKKFEENCKFAKIYPLFEQKELNINHPNYEKLEDIFNKNGFSNTPLLAVRLIHSGMDIETFKSLSLISHFIDLNRLYELIHVNKDLIKSIYIKYDHTFLVLTDLFHNFPWESMPVFENMNITRVPSIALLKKLLSRNLESKTVKLQQQHDISLILNPNNDLIKTQQNFEPIFDPILDQKVIGKSPSEIQFINSLTNSKLFIYLGHGNGIQYTSSKMLKKQKNIAPSLLIGCSSVKITNNNSFFGYGTLISYLIGGCPLVLGNLWDVTDKDIDLFSLSLFNKIGIISNDGKGERIDIACRESRNDCRLRYLNGSAPVIYGLPLSFELK